MHVSQDDRLISAEQRVVLRGREQPSQEFTYKLDGSETSAEVARPLRGTVSLRAKWNEAAKTLELTAVNTGEVADKPVSPRSDWKIIRLLHSHSRHLTIDNQIVIVTSCLPLTNTQQ